MAFLRATIPMNRCFHLPTGTVRPPVVVGRPRVGEGRGENELREYDTLARRSATIKVPKVKTIKRTK
jgi:hypothetical protein